jgi:hypothetical protein
MQDANNTIKLTNDPAEMPELFIAEDGFFYLAHAYSNDDRSILEMNVLHARWVYSNLFVRGVLTYNPLEATHLAASSFSWPTAHEPYIRLNHAFIDTAVGVLVVTSDGWEKSRGVAEEIAYATECGVPVWYLDVEEFDNSYGFGMPEVMPDA